MNSQVLHCLILEQYARGTVFLPEDYAGQQISKKSVKKSFILKKYIFLLLWHPELKFDAIDLMIDLCGQCKE